MNRTKTCGHIYVTHCAFQNRGENGLGYGRRKLGRFLYNLCRNQNVPDFKIDLLKELENLGFPWLILQEETDVLAYFFPNFENVSSEGKVVFNDFLYPIFPDKRLLKPDVFGRRLAGWGVGDGCWEMSKTSNTTRFILSENVRKLPGYLLVQDILRRLYVQYGFDLEKPKDESSPFAQIFALRRADTFTILEKKCFRKNLVDILPNKDAVKENSNSLYFRVGKVYKTMYIASLIQHGLFSDLRRTRYNEALLYLKANQARGVEYVLHYKLEPLRIPPALGDLSSIVDENSWVSFFDTDGSLWYYARPDTAYKKSLQIRFELALS